MSTELTTIKKRPLPKIDELYKDVSLVSQQNELNRLLNCEPKKEWVRQHPFASNVTYMPISVIEYLLTSIFVKWRVEIKEVKLVANSCVCIIRLHVQDPVTGEWDWQDGIGATPIQTSKGSPATDFNNVLTDAVMKSAPSAESYAVKDAAEKFGKLFGKDLNRKDFLSYTSLDGKLDTSNIQADADMIAELRQLLFTSSFDNEEKEIMFDKLRTFFSVAEYDTMKFSCLQNQTSPLDELRNGKLLLAKDMKKANTEFANEKNS